METQQIIALLLIGLFIWVCKPKGEKKKVVKEPRYKPEEYKKYKTKILNEQEN